MAYHAPELLLVGAAQNLVLGRTKAELGDSVNHDDGDDLYKIGIGIPFDSASW